MSWHFSQALVAGYSQVEYSVGAPFAQSRSAPSPEAFSWSGSETEHLTRSQSGTTLDHSMAQYGEAVLTWCLEASPVRTLAAPGRAQDSPESVAAFGWRWLESFVKWDRVSHSWKTRQTSLFEDSTSFSPTWPKWGWMRDGECSALPMLEHDTSVRGSLSLPTVTASWGRRGPGLSNNLDNRRMSASATDSTLQIVSRFGWRWPTPLVEWMMMWPIGWSALTPLATDSYQAWLREHGKC